MPGSVVVEVEDVLVERDLRGETIRYKVGQSLLLVAGIRRIDRSTARQNHPQSFVVHEEEGLVTLDGTAERRCPLVRGVKGPRSSGGVCEEIIRLHDEP